MNFQTIVETSSEICIAFLDAGAKFIVVDLDEVAVTLTDDNDQSEAAVLTKLSKARLPSDRLIASISTGSLGLIGNSLNEVCKNLNFIASTSEELATIIEALRSPSSKSFKTTVTISQDLAEQQPEVTSMITTNTSKGGVSSHLCLEHPSIQYLARTFSNLIITDRPDGLFTTVVTTRQGIALGLVYSSKESIIAAVESGRGVYYSRSRNGIWRKGETSGNFQVLHRIDLDCDGDAVRFTVSQKGEEPAFCHLNTLSCWGEVGGMTHLEETLKERLKEAPEGSYTKRLFEDDELLRNKLLEEAQELAEAQDPQHVAEELADVLYFAMVRAVKAGVGLDDAVEVLDQRARKVTRRPGNAKDFRIKAAEEILGGK